MQEIKLKAKEDRRLKAGHWWVFSNEIDGLDTSIEPGTLVRVLASDGVQVGVGTFNPHSLIAVRLLQKAFRPPQATHRTQHVSVHHRRNAPPNPTRKV